MNQTTTQTIGQSAELFAEHYLLSYGLKTIHRNFSCKIGEIDLIMYDPDKKQLIFVEVRFRKNTRFGTAAESINSAKQKKLIRTAKYYLLTQAKSQQLSCRFDVVAINYQLDKQHTEWIQNAFYAT